MYYKTEKKITRIKIINQMLPDILACIFHLLVKVLKYKKENPEKIKLQEYPMMSDLPNVEKLFQDVADTKTVNLLKHTSPNIDKEKV